jgi:hypothetical protein
MAVWRPRNFELTPETLLKVMASDVEKDQACRQHLYVKTRYGSEIVGARGWAKRWDSDDIPLKRFLYALEAYFRKIRRGMTDAEALASSRLTYRNAHPGLRAFLDNAFDNYLDFLSSRETLLGHEAKYLGFNHQERVTQRGSLAIWGAPSFEIGEGHIEIHRLRIRRTRPELTGWAYLAAYLMSRRPQCTHVSILDVSLYHAPGSIANESVLIDRLAAEQAIVGYEREVRPRALAMIEGGEPKPGRDCDACKVVGVCDALVPMDGALQQEDHGPYTRAVSATDLSTYERCPARWYMQTKASLPESDDFHGSEAAERGRLVHLWLATAHRRGSACTADDMPLPQDWTSAHVAGTLLDPDEYATAFPFLLQHLEICPLSSDTAFVMAEEVIYGWDSTADTVIACKPDLVYRRGNELVLRETKTTNNPIPIDDDVARDAYDGIVYWLLVMADMGYVSKFDCSTVRVELEILHTEDAVVHSYRGDDITLMTIAETRVRSKVEEWHEDTEFRTKPGVQCQTCSMSTWCPDSDAHIAGAVPAGTTLGTGSPF